MAKEAFKPGSKVIIKSGPFKDNKGVVLSIANNGRFLLYTVILEGDSHPQEFDKASLKYDRATPVQPQQIPQSLQQHQQQEEAAPLESSPTIAPPDVEEELCPENLSEEMGKIEAPM